MRKRIRVTIKTEVDRHAITRCPQRSDSQWMLENASATKRVRQVELMKLAPVPCFDVAAEFFLKFTTGFVQR